MTNYQNGKVYVIEALNGEEGDIYVGSTAKQYLSQRMEKHRTSYKYWKEGKASYTTAYNLFDKYGLENCSIMLLETYPCNSRDDLRAREGYHIRNIACVNKRIEGRTRSKWLMDTDYVEKHKEYFKQWRIDNADDIKEKMTKYCAKNAENLKEQKKQWYINNAEKIKQYRENNAEKIREQKKQYNLENAEKIREQKKQWYQDNKAIKALNI
jgi:hypothetical protein